MKNSIFYGIIFIVAVMSFGMGFKANDLWTTDLTSHIYRQDEVKKSSGSWGNIYIYTGDTTTTLGTSSMLTAMLEFMPGKKLQPPHKHAEEEFQYVMEGSGTWTLNGKEVPIKKGDLMYAKPWDLHGIENTGTDTLKFFVFKYLSKGVAKAVEK
jgi:mannose-6-phosphate isomerase-like protein (cupin superfamily)